MKVAVYAISKNERQQVKRFMDSIDAAGLPVYVLDHSTDGTTELLRARGAHVDTTPTIPWSWDAGKNAALALVPADYNWVISLDLDEVLNNNVHDVVAQIDEKATRVRHLAKLDGDIARLTEHYRLHKRHGYHWYWPVHEFLVPDEGAEDRIQFIPISMITHWPTKGKKHTATEGLRAAVAEMPNDTRMRLLFARDLYFDGLYSESLKEFLFFLKMKGAISVDLSYAHTMIARCHRKLGDGKSDLASLAKSIKVHKRRESFVELAFAYLQRGMNAEALEVATISLSIKEGEFAANNDPGAWSFKPYEIGMLACYNMNIMPLAKSFGKKALENACEEDDQKRISSNLTQMGEL